MKKVFHVAAFLALAALILFAPVIVSHLPVRSDEVVKKAYESWSGVLRVWICEGFEPGSGSLTGWLYTDFSKFEKKHPGVYVQLRAVSSQTLAAFAEDDVPPPDLLIYAPGMLASPAGLKALDGEYAHLKPALRNLGNFGGLRYAVPVAMGGYGWMANRSMLPEIPPDFSPLPQPTPKAHSSKKSSKNQLYLMDVPSDSDYVSWSAALISLLSEIEPPSNGADARPPAGEGLDLGLAVPETPAPEITPAPVEESFLYSGLPSPLPQSFRTGKTVFSAFANGTIAAIPATQREIRRIALLSESGRAPDYMIKTAGAPFTDQFALISAVERMEGSNPARESLGLELIDALLSDVSQQALTKARAFPVIANMPIYTADADMAAMEASLSSDRLLLCGAFDAAWREKASQLADRLQAGGIGAREAMNALRAVLRN